jgi:hypothetical protein
MSVTADNCRLTQQRLIQPDSRENPASLVCERLRGSGYSFLRGVKCEVHGGIAVLSGNVPTFHLKQVAQVLASHTPGVQQIENRLHVTNLGNRTGASVVAG